MTRRRVLVVDDEPTIAASVAARLRSEGFAVDVAHDGPSAMESVAANEPDLVLAPLLVGAVLTRRPRRPLRAMVVTGAAALLLLAAFDPERFVAEQNVARYAETGRIDVGYLTELSADAVPALARLPEPLRSCALGPIAARTTLPADWRSANLSRAQARDVLAGVVPSRGCGPSPD